MGLCMVVAKASESLLLSHCCSSFCCHNNWFLIARRHAVYHWTAAYASKGDSRIPSLWPGLPARHQLHFHVGFGSLHTCLLSLQLCLTLGNTVDCSPLGSSVHKILQGRILEWVAISYSRQSSQPRDQTRVSWISCIGRWILYHCATWETLKSKPAWQQS